MHTPPHTPTPTHPPTHTHPHTHTCACTHTHTHTHTHTRTHTHCISNQKDEKMVNTFRINRNYTFVRKVQYPYITATTSSLVTLSNPVNFILSLTYYLIILQIFLLLNKRKLLEYFEKISCGGENRYKPYYP